MSAINLNSAVIESHDEYHRRSGEYLSSHLLAAFRRCPREYQLRVSGNITSPDSSAMRFGRAFHCLALEGDATFFQLYEAGGPINPKTGNPFGADTKASREYAKTAGKTILDLDDYGLMREMAFALQSHHVAQDLLVRTMRESVFRHDVCGLPCQARCDAVDEDRIVDLKTIDDIDDFERQARSYGYLNQIAFYAAVASENARCVRCWFVVVEKRAPYRVGVWELFGHNMYSAIDENNAAMRRLSALRTTAVDEAWPTGYECVQHFLKS